MKLQQLEVGDAVYARQPIYNDGGIHGIAADALLADTGRRGLLVNKGHLEEAPEQEIYLVRFEDENLDLGPATGCLPEELSAQPIAGENGAADGQR
jgi:nitrogen fixation protein NifZ